ncbi:CMGC family protein kinase [Trichomonas vaginalis G3]|uniref:CMGC family protein kinase n=1 Tax=Trichomonas vaginalis (strain ATCC PRA-98 / G3) TaxID=412133 RepID=A2G1U9_TRIV3|nr:CMGC family protein kinase [Trichomonas vaginalis G3]|eukprot:XP_001301807.1 CMGC family protein kinase [Trichomonas vaginalis G3]
MLKPICKEIQKIENRFRPIESIGGGSFGSVTKSLDIKNNRIVALKKLKSFSSEQDEERIVNEVTIVQKLNHPNIVKIYDIFYSTSENCYYISMEYCQQDLLALLETHTLNPTQKKSIMKQILEALAYLEKRNIIHQDLKPANILVQDGMRIKLADFGLATYYTTDHEMTNCGTLAYNPPEKHLESTILTKTIDVWSAGVLFYQLITHKVLFQSGLQDVITICGAPDPKLWPNVMTFKNYNKCLQWASSNPSLNSLFTENDKSNYGNVIERIKSMLSLYPDQRPLPSALLESKDFDSESVSIQINEEFHQKVHQKSRKPLENLPIVRPRLPDLSILCY